MESKTKFIFLIIILFQSLTGQTQVFTSKVKVFVTNNNFTGIGTDQPQYQLDVNGSINASSFLIDGEPFSSNSSWLKTVNGMAYSMGNIGIGINSPASLLHVERNANNYENVATFRNLNPGSNAYTEIVLGNNAQIEALTLGVGSSNNSTNPDGAFLYNRRNGDLFFGTNDTERIRVLSNGKVGIGTNQPQYQLDVNGSINASSFLIDGEPFGSNSSWSKTANDMTYSIGNVGIGINSPVSLLHVERNANNYENVATFRNLSPGNNAYTEIVLGNNAQIEALTLGVGSSNNSTNPDGAFLYNRRNGDLFFGTNDTERIRVLSNGKIGIGTSTPTYNLEVNGSIKGTSLHTDTQSWSDFVFYSDYNLMPLEEVEIYIFQNQHLPEIPSEAEVLKKGIDIAEMNAKLLQKIEELTLYLIEEHKNNVKLTLEIEELKEKFQSLEPK